ncbi:calcineurin-binding protein cabin-1-like [Chironomus tepperi]|uniref:calcineurin-binding protein cabin-1-like n=1 Tax=Chironomus tepperi TaxID=113505 RepID=UPI00391EFB75
MIKITALNDLTKDEDDFQEENVQVSKEAQETIAASEYLRALSLKQHGKSDFALSLFEDLLRTNVIYDVPNDDKDNKLFSVKYNCYRNIGLIYEEKKEYELALKFLVDAINLDDTDVYTQLKVGKIALKLDKLMTAKRSFEKCLERNPNHCSAKDGYLETLCQMELIEAAYGFALKCYAEDRKYERAIRVLKEIRERFKFSREYYDGIYGYAPEFDPDCKVFYDPQKSVFPTNRVPKFPVDTYTVVPDDMKIPEEEISWITFGKMIHKVYEYTIDNKHSLLTMYKWHDWVCKTKEPEPEEPKPSEESESTEKTQNDGEQNEELMKEPDPQSDGNDQKSPEGDSENPDQESKKSSNRRRCSDLDFLKEWGWHKNRRSTRKKQKEEEDTVDTSINGLIRRILPNYFTQTFDTKNSPFIPEVVTDEKTDGNDTLDTSKADAENEEKFNELSKESFGKFIASFKEREFDLLIPLFEWLRYISLYWNQTIIPAEIISIYKKIYAIYEDCIDYHNMHHMSDDEFTATFRAAMFYFELLFDEYEETKAEIPDDYIRLKDFLQVNIAFIDDDMDCTRMLVRLLRLSYGIHLHYNNYKDSLGFLYKIEEIFDVPKYQDIAFDFKNCKHHKTIDFKTVKDLVVKIERKINLASVKKLYDTQNYEELVEILLESITYSTGPKVNIDSLTLKIQTQIEVLLECLFSLNRIEECLSYAERSLYYAITNFVSAPTEYRLEEWATLVNFCLVYIEAIIREDGNDMLFTLNDKLPRLVQSLTQIITSQLDSPFDKNCPKMHLINLTSPWIILFPLVQREDDILNALHSKKKVNDENVEVEEFGVVANAITMLFSAHELMGRKQWCMKDNGKLWLFLLDNLAPIYRTPMLDPFRDYIAENLEQNTYCLYGFPAKKARLRHIEEHDAKNIDLTWERAIQLFDLYRPETLPEFDSFKLSSITAEMEQLLQRILLLIPKCLDIQPFVGEIRNFINGTVTALPKEMNILPSKISTIYYLLADFYFKNQETGKAIKFFISDLTMKPDRFDSWASISLCKQSKLEMRLNSYNSIDVKNYLDMADQAIICFNQCLKLKKTSTILTEFGSFTYHLHSFCSRNLKQASETLSMENFAALEERKEKFLNLSYKCFTEVSQPTFDMTTAKNSEDDENHDEKWYYSFMLGKIAEKRKEVPSIYLNLYLKSAKYLYEDNATYPIKINHNNPTHLAIESLEVFYRTTACIMKFIEQHGKINKPTAKLFMRILKELATSPFAYNRAKINEDNINALKRKINTTSVGEANQSKQKVPKLEQTQTAKKSEETEENLSEMLLLNLTNVIGDVENMEVDAVPKENDEQKPVETTEADENQQEPPIQPVIRKIIDTEAGSRRGSQESAMTSTTTTTTTHSSSTSSDSSSDSSDSDSTSSDDETDQENVYVDEETISTIYKMCIKNFEECISRFPEHYKSIYRLVYHFLNINESLDKCRQLLLTSDYKTTLGNSVGGLFHERKNNNFFNGIWRIPSQEIDRPGNFTTHLSKCVIILMDVLKKTNDYETLIDLALQLQRNPEADKKYLSDTDKKELFQQAVACGVQAFKNKLREVMNGIVDGKNNDRDLLSLMLEIFKANRKTLKTFQQKDQSLFSGVLVEVYKEYIKDKMILPENANYTDLAFKMCQQEINYRKNLEKGIITTNPNPVIPLTHQQPLITQATSSPILVKSVSEINKSIMGNSKPGTPNPQTNKDQNALSSAEKTPVTTTASSSANTSSSSARTKPRSSNANKSTAASATNLNSMYNSMLMALYSNPAVLTSSYISEYYKMLGMPSSSSAAAPQLTAQQLALLGDPNFANTLLSSLTGVGSSPNSSKTASSSDLKLLESLMSSTATATAASSKGNHLQGLQQNLMSNSLSITTTTITSTTSTSNRMSLGSASTNTTVSKSQANVSVRKSMGDAKEHSKKSKDPIAAKMADNLSKYGLLGTSLNLPDLPKSLSITPTIPSGSGMKSSSEKKSKEKASLSMSASQSAASLGKYNLNPSLSITPETYSSTQNASRLNMLQSYQEFLKSYPNTQQQQLPSKKAGLATVGHGATTSLLKQQKSKNVSQPSSQQKKSQVPNTKIPYDFGKNIASSFSGHPMASPKPTHSSSPFQHTPPLTPSPSSIVSPPKTLQQKLAERKQQNQQQKSNANKKPDNDDVIVLD